MQSANNVTLKEVNKVKLMLSKGMNTVEIGEIIGRSKTTIRNIRDWKYDFLLQPDEPEVDQPAWDTSRTEVILQSIDNRLYTMCEILKRLSTQLDAMDGKLGSIADNTRDTVTAGIAINDAVSKLNSSAGSKPALIGKDFDRWGEVVRRVQSYGGSQMSGKLHDVRATLDNTVLYLWCSKEAKEYLVGSATAIPLIKQHTKAVIGYPVEVRLKDR